MRPFAPLWLCLCAACGASGSTPAAGRDAGGSGKDGAAPDARAETSASPPPPPEAGASYPATHPPMPLVVNLGGRLLDRPRVVPVFYEGDPMMGSVSTFLRELSTAAYWEGATGEYGVGALRVASPVVLPGPAPSTLTNAELASLVATHVDASALDAGVDGGAAWPAPDGETVYAIFTPDETTVTVGTETSCAAFAGYHIETAYSGGQVPYAVLPRCPSFDLLPGADALEILTVAASHELAEAATDPFPLSSAAYATVDFDGTGYAQNGVGGEIADLCVLEPSSFYTPAGMDFTVQRVWSNTNAGAGGDPCAPAPTGEVYFNAAPDLAMAEMTAGQYVAGVTVPPGGTTSVTLHLWSGAKTAGPWTVAAKESGETGTSLPPDPSHQLSFSLEPATGVNGDSMRLTIHRSPLTGGETATGLGIQITSTLGAASHSYWTIAGY